MDEQITEETVHALIKLAKEEGIHRDMFKSELMDIMSARSRYRLRGEAGAKALGKDLGEAFRIIDETWDNQEENCNANDPTT